MAYTRRGFKGGAKATTIAGSINNGTLTIPAADLSTWAGVTSNGPATATINRGQSDEEVITFTGISGNSLTGVTRSQGGTTAPATTASGATLEHTSSVIDFDEPNAHIADTSLDHHTQYFNTTRGDARYKLKAAIAVVVKVSSTVVTLVDSTTSTISWDQEDIDTDGFHSTVSNTSRLTVPAGLAGKYRVWAVVEFGASATGYRSMDFRINGSGAVHTLAAAAAGVSADTIPTLVGAQVVALAAGDYVELRLYQNSGGALTFNANGATRFGLDWLGT